MEILIIESDTATATEHADQLRLDGHAVTVARSRPSAHSLLTRIPDAIVLGQLESRYEALALLRDLRAGEIPNTNPVTPTLTFGGDTEQTAAAHYAAGADITIPAGAGTPLLSAALGALAARRGPAAAEQHVLRHGALMIDLDARQAQLHDRPLMLSRREYDLLAALIEEPGHLRTREQLGRDVWGWAVTLAHSRTIDSHVARLRRKLAEAGGAGAIENVHGLGYRFSTTAIQPTQER